MSIITPTNAIEFKELDSAQIDFSKEHLEINGCKIIFISEKTSTNHETNISEIKEGLSYLIKCDNIIEEGNTISDILLNSYEVNFLNCEYIPSN